MSKEQHAIQLPAEEVVVEIQARSASGLFKLRVNVTGKLLDDIEVLVAEGYFADKSSLVREALGPFVQAKMEQYLFERISKQRIIGSEVELDAHVAQLERLKQTQLSGDAGQEGSPKV